MGLSKTTTYRFGLVPIVSDAIGRFVGWLFLGIVSFPWFIFTGWLTLKVLTLGLRPSGMWYEYETFDGIYWFGVFLVFTIGSVVAIRLAWG